MFCSAIIPTVGRDTLERAVRSVLEQSAPEFEFELIVVNDSGKPLADAEWMADPRVRVLETQRRERSAARNAGAATAAGEYLHFLDDDDWASPGAYEAFFRATRENPAAWVHGNAAMVRPDGTVAAELRHELPGDAFLATLAGEWIPLQSSLIRADAFFEVGGFHRRLTGPEDIDLLRKIALRREVAGIDRAVASITVEHATTTDYESHPEASRWAREAILDDPATFRRSRLGALTPFWHGRRLRIYATSLVWNLRRGRGFHVLSRAAAALHAAGQAGTALGSGELRRSAAGPYRSRSFRPQEART